MTAAPRKLALHDIADLRAYERERDEFRARVIAEKKRRRVPVGPLVTLVFENRDTIRFQVQEMARAERMLSDIAIQQELDTYNPLIPDPGELSATLFVELTSRAQLEEWLPKLAGVERAVRLELGEGEGTDVVAARLDEAHAAQLTREAVTASVHYVRWSLDAPQVERVAAGPVRLAIRHGAYDEVTVLGDDTRAALLEDLRPS